MISYYELLGMIKEDKAPSKIKVHLIPRTSKLYVREDDIDDTFNCYVIDEDEETSEDYHYYLAECFLESDMFDKNIEILENLSTTNNECATHGTETLISNKDCLTVNDFKSWLSTHNTIFYYVDEKKIERINKNYNIRILDLDKPHTIKDYDMEQLLEMVQDIYEKQDEIIDYLKSKGDE